MSIKAWVDAEKGVKMGKEIEVLCTVEPGMFNSEFCVTVESQFERFWQGFVDKDLVTLMTCNQAGGKGYVKAYLVETLEDGKSRVEFPVDGLAIGRRVTIPSYLLG